MPDVLDVLRGADPVPRNRWSETAEGCATRDRAFALPASPEPARRHALTVLVAAAVVFAIVASVVVATRSDDTSTPGKSTISQFVRGKWSELDAGPARGLFRPTSVWTGKEFLVLGPLDGSGATEGAAFNPRTGEWRRIADPPVSTSITPVWTGNRLIVWSGLAVENFALVPGPGAAYHPRTDTWDRIAVAPVQPAQDTIAVWTGRELVVIGAVPECRDTADCSVRAVGAAAYDPATGAWRSVPPLPAEISDPHAGWDGREVVVWGRRAGELNATAYHPGSNTWIGLPPPPLALGGSAVVPLPEGPLWIGLQGSFPSTSSPPSGVIVRAIAFDAAIGWRERAPVLHEGSICPVEATKVASFVVVLCAPGDRSAALELATGRWRTVPTPPRLSGDVVWTGRELLALSADGHKLLRYRPSS